MQKRVWELADKSVRQVWDRTNRSNEMTPEKLIEILKRYQRESNQEERMLAARIGVNHHTVNRWLKDEQSPMKGKLALAASFLRRVGYL